MAAQIFACGGTVEKYIGDEIFAVFGLLKAEVDDAANALRCANGMLAALDAWNAERAGRGEPALSIGIGLNYGPAVMGDVGSDQGLSFTVIGDTVNTASRLQGADPRSQDTAGGGRRDRLQHRRRAIAGTEDAACLVVGPRRTGAEGPQRRRSHLDEGTRV